MTSETQFLQFFGIKFYHRILCRMTTVLFIRILLPYNKKKIMDERRNRCALHHQAF